MAKTANLYARIEPDVKEEAENILSALGRRRKALYSIECKAFNMF